MIFHKEGITPMALCILVIFVLNALVHFYYPGAESLRYLFYGISAVLFLATLWLFRNPGVRTERYDDRVLSPASGYIKLIEETTENEYLHDERIRILITTRATDVYVNRNPVSGTVKYLQHYNGQYLLGLVPQSAGEHDTLAIETATGITLLIRQTTGWLSRRIARYVQQGQFVEQGKIFGAAQFGSDVEIYLPLNVRLVVSEGESVKAGQTVLASLS